MPPERDQQVLTSSPGVLIICLTSLGNQGLGVFQFPADELAGGTPGALAKALVGKGVAWWGLLGKASKTDVGKSQ